MSSWLPRSKKPIGRKKAVKKVNPERRKKEFARCYGSSERVAFVQSLPCLLCGAVPSENAHTDRRAGVGRKGPYTAIVPLCRPHHVGYDAGHLDVLERKIEEKAAYVETLWQAHHQEHA